MSVGGIKKYHHAYSEIIRRTEIIGETVKNISSAVGIQVPQIPRKKIAGLRAVVIHNYFGISSIRIWKIVTPDFLELKTQMICLKTSLR